MSPRHGLVDLRPLGTSPPFRRLWVGISLGAVGRQVAMVAVLFQVWEMTASPLWTGVIGLVRAIPMIVFGLLGGALADAVDRRALVRWAMTGQILCALGLAGQAVAGLDNLALVLALVSVLAACGALGAPAQRTFPTRLLVRDQVAAGIALQHLSFQFAMLGGPALAGVIIGGWGLTAAYLVQATASAAALYGVVRLPAVPPLGAPARRGVGGVVDGCRYVAHRPVLRGLCLTDLFATVLAMPIALFPMINEQRFGGDPETLGLFLSAVAAGGILAGLASGLVTRADRLGAVQFGAAMVWGVALAAFGLLGPLWLALGALAVAGAADTVSVISRAALIQLATPDSHRGRVSSVEHVIGVAGPDLGNFRGGLVAGATSAAFSLVSGGAMCVLGVLAVGATHRPLRRLRVSALEPASPGSGTP